MAAVRVKMVAERREATWTCQPARARAHAAARAEGPPPRMTAVWVDFERWPLIWRGQDEGGEGVAFEEAKGMMEGMVRLVMRV